MRYGNASKIMNRVDNVQDRDMPLLVVMFFTEKPRWQLLTLLQQLKACLSV